MLFPFTFFRIRQFPAVSRWRNWSHGRRRRRRIGFVASERLRTRWRSLVAKHRQISILVSVSRVNQFDAARLDVEMSAILKEYSQFGWTSPQRTYLLMNLRSRDATVPVEREILRTGLEGPALSIAQKIWYLHCKCWQSVHMGKNSFFSAFRRWGVTNQRSLAQLAWVLVQRIEGFYKAASFGNLLAFLYTGRYRNLIGRALKARLVYDSPNMNRAVSFEYMNHQLVWNEFSEMLLLLLPLLSSSSLKNLLHPFSKDKNKDSGGDESVCSICQSIPSIPFLAFPCRHRYCYHCLRTRCAAAPSFRCLGCNELVTPMQRHSK